MMKIFKRHDTFPLFSFSNGDPGLPRELQQRPVLGRPGRVVPAAQELAADEHARDRRRAGEPQGRLDLAAVLALVELPDLRRRDPRLAQRRADGVLGLVAVGAVRLGKDLRRIGGAGRGGEGLEEEDRRGGRKRWRGWRRREVGVEVGRRKRNLCCCRFIVAFLLPFFFLP